MELNIAETSDPHFRYKMPRLEVQQVRRTTTVSNLAAVAKSLRVGPGLLMRYFCLELGIATSSSKLQGCHTSAALQTLLRRFIDDYLLCVQCGLPELALTSRTAYLKQQCAACGHSNKIPIDSHKIIKSFKQK